MLLTYFPITRPLQIPLKTKQQKKNNQLEKVKTIKDGTNKIPKTLLIKPLQNKTITLRNPAENIKTIEAKTARGPSATGPIIIMDIIFTTQTNIPVSSEGNRNKTPVNERQNKCYVLSEPGIKA